METTQFSVPASLIRQFCFCPRIPWFNEIKEVNPGDRKWQKQGVSFHERQTMLMKRRQLSRFGFASGEVKFNVQLKSEKLRCHGIADALVIKEHKISAVDFKLSGHKPSKGQVLQTAAYGMMAEQSFDLHCNRVFILIGDKGKTFSFELDEVLRKKVRQTLKDILDSFSIPILPDSPATSVQCGQCEYYNFCGDR